MKPDKRLADTKVYVNGKSKEIQEKAFQLGYKWSNKGAKVTNENYPFLFFMNGEILCSNDMDIFKTKGDKKEVSADYILSLEPEPEYSFKPFDKVLVRDFDKDAWVPRFFWKKEDVEKEPFVVIGGLRWRQCVPFKGEKSQCSFNMFEKVLVRMGDGPWKPDFFAKYDPINRKFMTVSGIIYNSCVPYEGNEDIENTYKTPNVERRII